MKSIILVKLSSTEEVIAVVEDESETHYTLTRPRILAPQAVANGQVSIALIPWMIGQQDPESGFECDVVVDKSAVVGTIQDPPKALVDTYLSKTSGISLITG